MCVFMPFSPSKCVCVRACVLMWSWVCMCVSVCLFSCGKKEEDKQSVWLQGGK